ncbi:hypothetical protein EIN_344590 [Entamoeba invadens IP1]|uniref:TLDc domain-containing protein n=1 Tax=Entamoeba invadens IP1 TaxID=370355 RepID=A0A0A1U3A4_ENTIV|nr:hypothetical protein EIN_344590 [Entamoeba invadens IP1]ELP88509.1 hypothetical protein EIN_344590 [Entamoeba invadens IP1]|eukprot:XP_004255280.1 hypothetical protein EIN_344590 [Entamoeba invadens IP1]
MSEPATPREDAKQDKQFEKDKENIKKYAKDLNRFFSYTKKRPNFKVVYSSTLYGFDRKKLYDTVTGQGNIMFCFETVKGDVFGCFDELEIPEANKYGSNSINNDPHYFVFSLVNKSFYGAFSLTLSDQKEKKNKAFAYTPTPRGVGIVDGVTNLGTSMVTGITQGITQGITSSVDVISTIGQTSTKDSEDKKKVRSLYVSSVVNTDWLLETYCGFIISGNEVMFNKRMGSYYKIDVAPEVLSDDERQKAEFLSKVQDLFVGGNQPKAVELKKMIVMQFTFDTKK